MASDDKCPRMAVCMGIEMDQISDPTRMGRAFFM